MKRLKEKKLLFTVVAVECRLIKARNDLNFELKVVWVVLINKARAFTVKRKKNVGN